MEEIGKILPKVLKPQFSRMEPPVVEVLGPLWTQVAGKVLAKQCRPTAFSAGTLTLSTTDPDWAGPLSQMAEEIRTHVNKFLGRPVVRHVRIVCLHKSTRDDGAPGLVDSLSVAKPGRGNWPLQNRRTLPAMPEPIGRSRVKFVARKHGKVH